MSMWEREQQGELRPPREKPDLPTAWWCPVCKARTLGQNLVHITDGKPCRGKSVEVPMIPPGTPLTDILGALGIEYRELWMVGDGGHGLVAWETPVFPKQWTPYLAVPIPATDEARDG